MRLEHLFDQHLPGEKLTKDEVKYLYNLTGDEELKPEHFARSKDMAVDILMTNLVRSYKYEDQNMIADMVATVKPVRSRTGTWKTRGKEALNIYADVQGSDSGGTNEIGMAVSEGTYTCTKRKLKILVTDDEMQERGVLDPVQEATILLKHGIDLNQEIVIRNLADATSNGATIGTDWDTSDAVHADVAASKLAFIAQLGSPATHIILPDHVATEILGNTYIKADVFNATSISKGSEAFAYLDLQQFPKRPWGLTPLIPNGFYNSADDVGDAASPTRVWGDDAFLVRIDKSARACTWAVQQELLKPTIVRWREEDKDGWYYKVISKRDQNEVTSEAIYKMADVT